jgi:hypothetical protein
MFARLIHTVWISATLQVLMLAGAPSCVAQQPFVEGTIVYNIKMTLTDANGRSTAVDGSYTYYVKGMRLVKEIRLDNGYKDKVVINGLKKTVYSLREVNGRKYAIQLEVSDITRDQTAYQNFALIAEDEPTYKIANCEARKGHLKYRDNTEKEISYTSAWYLSSPFAFERFPGARFLPVSFTYQDATGATMEFNLDKMDEEPVDNAVFTIPGDYKIISYAEYRQMNR